MPKSTAEILSQCNRIHHLLMDTTKAKLIREDPHTGGNITLANNWGAGNCRSVLDQYYERSHRIFLIRKRALEVAFCLEYPDHLLSRTAYAH